MLGNLKRATISTGLGLGLAAILSATAVAGGDPVIPGGGPYNIKGVGASFPAAIYNFWESKFKQQTGANANLQFVGTGTGSGKNAVRDGTADYGAGDAFLTDTELADILDTSDGDGTGLHMVHVPTVIGGVALGVRLDCTAKSPSLTGANVGDIFSGVITKWGDSKLRSGGRNAFLNTSACKNVAIKPIHRSDSSGTTFIFTSYLWKSTTSYWANKLQANPDPHGAQQITWPTGQGAPRNSGVATKVKNTNGAIGYMEKAYAVQANLKVAPVQNGDHSKFLKPTTATVTTAAANGPAAPSDLRMLPVISATGSNSYPIVGYTMLFLYQDCTDAKCGTHPGSLNAYKMLVAYVFWCLQTTEGQSFAGGLNYAPLPSAVRNAAEAKLHTLTWNGSAIWP